MISLKIDAPVEVESAMRRWFFEGRLDFDAELECRVTVGEVNEPVRRDAFANQRDGATVWLPSVEHPTLDIWWARHRSALSIRNGGRGVALVLAPEVADDLGSHAQWVLVTLAALTLKAAGRFHIHAASTRAPSGQGWMLVGDSGSGKSTTIGLLAALGWTISTDDVAFLERSPEGLAAVRGFRSPVALRPEGFRLLRALGGADLGRRGKRGFWPEELGSRWEALIVPDVLVFTAIGGERTVLEPVSKGTALKELFRRSFWPLLDPSGSDEYLGLLHDVAARADCYTARLAPDLFDDPRGLEGFVPKAP